MQSMSRRMRNRWTTAVVLAVLGFLAAPGAAQVQVGTVVAARGTVELQRGRAGTWAAAPVGQSVLIGDVVRTSERGGAKVLFGDDAVLDLGSAAQVTIGKYTADAAATEPRSLLKISAGRLRIRLSDFYATARLRYEVETPTAVVRVPAGGDVTLFVEASGAHSDVLVREGATAQVQGILGVIGPPVDVPPGQITRVQQGTFPAPPRDPTAQEIADAEGFEVVGTGSIDGLDVDHPVVAARLLGQEDRPESTAPGATRSGPSYLSPDIPGETLQDRLSPDLRTNTQPIPEFRNAPPGQQPTGTVDVPL